MSKIIFNTRNVFLFLIFALLISFMWVPAFGIRQGVLTHEESLHLYLRQDDSGALLKKAYAAQSANGYAQNSSSPDSWIYYDTSYSTNTTSSGTSPY